MIRISLAALALLAAIPAQAQSEQDALDARYDRALAAGYKALFLCSAIANAERNGATRTPESVNEWELTGIQPPLDRLVGELPYIIERDDPGMIRSVSVEYGNRAELRVARYRDGLGCSAMPIGSSQSLSLPPVALPAFADGPETSESELGVTIHQNSKSGGLDLLGSLRSAFEQAAAAHYGTGTRTTAIAVFDGADQHTVEWYQRGFDENTPQRTWSVAKSLAATLIGAAVYRGETDVGSSARLGADQDDPRQVITVDHLLRMSSGRYSDTPGNRTDPLYFGGATVSETAVHWPLILRPGTVYRYANNDTLMAVRAIERTFADHPPAELFARLGMYHTVAETDWQGSYVLSSQVWSTAPDLLRLGQLYLNDGVLPNGTRILPEGWVEYVSSPSGPQPEGRGVGYGAGFWLLNQSEGIPPDTFAAMGNRGQYVVIVPSRDVVIVRRGEDPAGTRFDIIAFTRDILAALEAE